MNETGAQRIYERLKATSVTPSAFFMEEQAVVALGDALATQRALVAELAGALEEMVAAMEGIHEPVGSSDWCSPCTAIDAARAALGRVGSEP